MADLFHRLVSGPVSAVPLAPRIPSPHEPSEASNVDDAQVLPPPPPSEVVRRMEIAPVEDVRGMRGDAAVPAVPGDLGVKVSLEQHKSAKISEGPQPEARLEPRPEPRPDLRPQVRPVREPRSPELRPREVHKREPQPQIQLRPRQTEPAPPPPAPRDAREPERTTVRIEIGRIEIRAPQPPASPPMATPAPQPEPQGLSLADYLRGHDGRPR